MTFRLLLLVFFFSCVLQISKASKNELSEQSYVSILTCGKSENYLYALFGHSAIRVKDPSKNIDLVYNYGTFNFNEELFYLKFINGNLKYFLSVTDFKTFYHSYYPENRSISEQKLNLNMEEKESLYSELNRQLNSEDRYYYYDFVRDNCSTRIIDLLSFVIGKEFDDALNCTNGRNEYSVRYLVNLYLPDNSYEKYGINLLLGVNSDKFNERNINLFLPDSLQSRLDQLLIKENKLVVKTEVLFDAKNNTTKERVLGSILLTYSIVIILMIIYTVFVKSKSVFWDKMIWYNLLLVWLILSLIGILLLYMELFSHIPIVKSNLNLLWCHPLYLLLYIKKIRKVSASIFICGIILFGSINIGFGNESYIFLPLLLFLTMSLLYTIRKTYTENRYAMSQEK